jgi:hypothetical protein
MDNLKKLLKIDDTFIKPPKKEKPTKINDVVTMMDGFNYMADILYLPETKEGYKYLLVITDLATREFDIEPLKSKNSDEVLKAMQTIFKRKFLSIPKASLRTDNGTEFKSKFDKWLKDHHIFHSVSMPYRHSQLSMVESLNKTLGYLFNGYCNQMEVKKGKPYREWTDVIDTIRKELNKIRYRKAKYDEKTIFDHVDPPVNLKKDPKFKVGDVVHYSLSYPEDALGHKQPTSSFRVGDYRFSSIPKKIKQVLYYSGPIPYRYMLEGMKNVSFTENQLIPSQEKDHKYVVEKIIGKKTSKKKVYYLVKWKNYKKSESTWEPKDKLIEDGFDEEIKEFEKK